MYTYTCTYVLDALCNKLTRTYQQKVHLGSIVQHLMVTRHSLESSPYYILRFIAPLGDKKEC